MVIGLSQTSPRAAPLPLAKRIYGRRGSTTQRVALILLIAAGLYFAIRMAPVVTHSDATIAQADTAHVEDAS